MKSRSTYIAVIISMLIINIIWPILYFKNQQNISLDIISKTREINYLINKTKDLDSVISLTYSVDLRNQIESRIDKLGIIKKTGLYLCCYFNSAVCKPCILSVMQDITSISIEVDFNNFLIFSNIKKSSGVISDFVWPTDVIEVKDFPTYKEHVFDLLLFIYEPGSGIRDIFNPQILPEFQQEYFQNIRKEIKFMHHRGFLNKVN